MNATVQVDEAKVGALVATGRELVEAVEAHRAAGRKLVDRIVELQQELNIAVPDEGDLRFDTEGYGDVFTSLLIAAGGLETGVEVPDDYAGGTEVHDWLQADLDYDEATGRGYALQPSEV